MNVSYFDLSASSGRVRNLFEPLSEKRMIRLSNLFFAKDTELHIGRSGSIRGVRFFVISLSGAKLFATLVSIFNGLKFIKNEKRSGKSVMYHYDTPDIKTLVFLLFAKLIGFRIVLDVIEDNRHYYKFKNLLHRFKNWSSVLIMKLLHPFIDVIFCISTSLQRVHRSSCFRNTSTYLLPISVNFRFFQASRTSRVNRALKIFYGGSYGEKDSIENLLRAFDIIASDFCNVSFVACGKGSESDMFQFFDTVSQLRNSRSVNYLGVLPIEQYYKLLNSCDIFCMTRTNSEFANAGFPFKLGEFLATGGAVIATRVSDVDIYLTDGVDSLLIPPDSLDELVAALRRVIISPELRENLGKNAREVARREFDSHVVSQRLFSVLNQ